MRLRSGMILILAGFALGGCAAAGATGGGGPVTSPTGRVYEPGTPPSESRFSQAALLAIAQQRFDEGLQEAQAGIAADSANPIHYYLAGEAAAGLGNFELADSLWNTAVQIYPAYELEVEPSRESAWAEAFNLGVEAYNAGNMQEAITQWRNADMIYKLRPEAAQNLAVVLTQEEQYEEAIRVYTSALESLDIEPATRVIEAEEQAERDEARAFMVESLVELLSFSGQHAESEALIRELLESDPDNVQLQAQLANSLSQQGRTADATEIYTRLLASPNLPAVEMFNIGVALFQSEDYERAGQAFEQVLSVQPNSRDALYNQANALYAAEAWEALIPVGERLVQVDPLNSTAALILARAQREAGNNDAALAVLEANEEYPIYVELQLAPATNQTMIQGTATGNAAAAGTPVTLVFTFYGDQGQTLGTQSVTVNAPAAEQTSEFQVSFSQVASAYSYQVQ